MHCDSGFRGFSVIAPTYAKNDEAYTSTYIEYRDVGIKQF